MSVSGCVSELSAPSAPPRLVPASIPLSSVEHAHASLLKLQAAVDLGLKVLGLATTYGAEAALDGLREVFDASSRLPAN